jgi:phosphate transport system substrate-binding protein
LTSSQEVLIRRASGISRTIFVIGLIAVATASGVGGYYFGGGFTNAGPITVSGAGSTFVYPFMSTLAAYYTATNPNVHVNYQSIGSGAGIAQFGAKTIDFGATDAPLSSSQRTNITNVIGTPLTIPESIGAVTIAYDLPGITASTPLNLTVTIAAKMFQSNITQWNDPAITQLNPGLTLPNRAIIVAHRSDSSGTTFVFTSWLAKDPVWKLGAGKSVQWTSGTRGGPGNEAVATLVQQNPYAIGYVELNYVLSTSPPMTFSAIFNPNSTPNTFVLPSLKTVSNAVSNSSSILPAGNGDWSSISLLNAFGSQSYPITSFTYLLVFQELSHVSGMTQAKAQALVSFLSYVVYEGQNRAGALSYVSLPTSVVEIDEATLTSITFNGNVLNHT